MIAFDQFELYAYGKQAIFYDRVMEEIGVFDLNGLHEITSGKDRERGMSIKISTSSLKVMKTAGIQVMPENVSGLPVYDISKNNLIRERFTLTETHCATFILLHPSARSRHCFLDDVIL